MPSTTKIEGEEILDAPGKNGNSSNVCGRQIRGVQWVDFFLFPRLKSIMKCALFADVAAIQERVIAGLRSIPKEAFADSFQKLYERCQQCVVKDGDYFEGQ
jgi:hypothetical protein